MSLKYLLANTLVATLLLGSLANWQSLANPKVSRVLYTPRKGLGVPQNTIGGTTRAGNCVGSECPVALAPAGEIPLTTLERPTLFFFVPNLKEVKASFQLFHQNERIYKNSFTVNPSGGIVQLALPSDAPALEIGKDYQWRLIVRDASNLNSLEGVVRRVTLDPKAATQIKQKQPLEAAETYGQEGIWLDMLKNLADAKVPEATTQMQDLLKSVKFDAIATKPLLECCKVSN